MLEVIDRRALFARVPRAVLRQPERLDFHLVIVCHSGAGRHQVDGMPVSMTPGVVLHVQPGQIHQWDDEGAYDAWLILAHQLPMIATSRAIGPRLRAASQASLTRVARLKEMARRPLKREQDRAIAERAIADLLAIELELTAPDPLPEGPYAPIYCAFQEDLAAKPDVRQRVAARAERLGYSPRTLTRACLAVAGRTAKQEADAYLALEARRLLAVPELSATAIAAHLGFSEPSNFAKFVRRVTGSAPATWRRQARSPRGIPRE